MRNRLLWGSALLIGVGVAFGVGALVYALSDHGPNGPRPVPGFDRVAFQVQGPAQGGVPGSAAPETTSRRRHCALLANTEPERERGLMARRDLGGYDGMIFQFSQAGRVPFYMKDTLIPLSIAWFDPSGRFVSATDMVPCPARTNCPFYYPAEPASTAIEVEQGHLAGLGIGPGTSISVGGACGA